MIGGHFLREALVGSIRLEDKAKKLRSSKDMDELVFNWFKHCDHEEGEVRVALQDVYSEMLVSFGALQP